MKKSKPKQVTISTENEKSFTMTSEDFIYNIYECIAEMQNIENASAYYHECIEMLLENFYAFQFLAREFNWKIPKAFKDLQVQMSEDEVKRNIKIFKKDANIY